MKSVCKGGKTVSPGTAGQLVRIEGDETIRANYYVVCKPSLVIAEIPTTVALGAYSIAIRTISYRKVAKRRSSPFPKVKKTVCPGKLALGVRVRRVIFALKREDSSGDYVIQNDDEAAATRSRAITES